MGGGRGLYEVRLPRAEFVGQEGAINAASEFKGQRRSGI